MNTKEYILSGILESYILGGSTEQELREVECLTIIYPEIRDELKKLELSFEKFAHALAKDPPPDLKMKIISAIGNVAQIPVDSAVKPISRPDVESESKRNLPLLIKFAIAASVTLLVAVTALWISSVRKNNETQNRLITMDNETRALRDQVFRLEEDKKLDERINSVLVHNATLKINLSGTKLSPESDVKVYWNTETREVFLKVNILPPPETGKQYQLWAIVDEKPQDMGVFDLAAATARVLQMPYAVDNAAAFAITLEKKGGNPAPTLSAMYVIGNV